MTDYRAFSLKIAISGQKNEKFEIFQELTDRNQRDWNNP